MSRITIPVVAVALGAIALSGCAAESSPGAEVTITCATCQESATDPFLQYNYEAAMRFNEAFEGQYTIETIDNPNAGSSADRLQYYQRLALADDLPDLFQLNSGEIRAMQETGMLHDFADNLDVDPEWAATFLDQSFAALSGDDGEIWAIPQQRDAIGIYFNADLLAAVGFNEFPSTWDEFEELAGRLADDGRIAIALDGDWATMLMWTNLIGTQDGGLEFLLEGLAGTEYQEDDAVVAATERLKEWHTKGWVNSDAFSGEFQSASAAYLSEQAAMIPNGPWYIKTNLLTDAAAPGLYDRTGYAPAPGWSEGDNGVIVVSGAGWVSGAVEDDKVEAVLEFLKFVSSEEEVLLQAQQTGANPPVRVDPAAVEAADLEPLSTGLIAASVDLAHQYPHVRVHGPAGFGNAWKNLWPAYVNGELSTEEFLQRLGEDANAGAQ